MSDLSSPTFDGPDTQRGRRPASRRLDRSSFPESSRATPVTTSDGERLGSCRHCSKRDSSPATQISARSFTEMASERSSGSKGIRAPTPSGAIRLLKEQAEANANPRDRQDDHVGGYRDIEFAVQLLQLVHGRFDPELRVTATLDAIDALIDRWVHQFEGEGEAMAELVHSSCAVLEHRHSVVRPEANTRDPRTPPMICDRLAKRLGLPSGQTESLRRASDVQVRNDRSRPP